MGVRTTPSALGSRLRRLGGWLGRVWAKNRDVPVTDHVRAILAALDMAGLPDRVPAETITTALEAYARPVLMVPTAPVVDDGGPERRLSGCGPARITWPCCRTMRTPGATLRHAPGPLRLSRQLLRT